MKPIHAAAAAVLLAGAARADDAKEAGERARSAMREALAAQATAPVRPPSLPDPSTPLPAEARGEAAARARSPEQSARAAHEQSVSRGARDAEAARAAAANRAAVGGAAGAMGQASSESRNAAGMMRTMQPSSGMMGGTGMGGGTGMMPQTAAPSTGTGTPATGPTPSGGMR